MIKLIDIKVAVLEHITETFNKFKCDPINVANSIAAKFFIRRVFKKFSSFEDENGLIDIEELDEIQEDVMEALEKLGKLEVPGICTKYDFNKADFHNLFVKIKQKGVGDNDV